MSPPAQEHVAELIGRLDEGDHAAADELLPLVYGELRQLAQHFLAQERPDHTLQATAVVHEAYMRLLGQSMAECKGREHFFALAATMIRRVLVDHARAHMAQKRGSGQPGVTLHGGVALPARGQDAIDVLSLHEALNTLEQLQPRQARVVELRFFAGLTVEEVAQVLNVSPRTVKDDWRFARAWLRAQLDEGEPA